MQWNWIDIIVILVVVVSSFHGWQMGFIHLFGTLLSFLGSFWLAVRLNGFVGLFLNQKFGIPVLWGDISAYVVIALVTQYIISEVANHYIGKIPKKIVHARASQVTGAIVGAIDGIIILAFFLIIFVILPVRGSVRQDIQESRLGSKVLQLARAYGGTATASLDQLARSAVHFLTVTPGSRDRMDIDITAKAGDLSVDQAGEKEMVALINASRATRNVYALVADGKLRVVAEAHSRDMFLRRYFSHVTPEGKDGADRMKQAGLVFSWAGENLGYAADIATVHEGFMNSDNHRRNIVDPEFHKVGVGVIDAGIYGKMITEDFTN